MDDHFNNGLNSDNDSLNPDKDGLNPEDEKQSASADTNPAEENQNTFTEPESSKSPDQKTENTSASAPGNSAMADHNSAAASDHSADTAAGGTTYSWVNPRLRKDQADSANSAANPWNSTSGADYWSTRTNPQNSRYSGSGSSSYTGSNNGSSNYSGTGSNSSNYGPGSSSHYNYHSSYTSDNPNKERRSFFEGNGQNGSYNNQSGSYDGQNGSYNGQSGSYNGQNGTYNSQRGSYSNPNSYTSYGGPSAGPAGPDKPGRRGKKNRPKRTGSGGGRKWGVLVAMALVFGLIAGTVSYGTNALANRIHPVEKTADANNEDSEDQENLFRSGSEEISSTSGQIQSTVPAESDTESADSTNSAADGQMTVAEVAKNCMPSMVTISTMSVEQMQSLFGGTQSYDVEGAGTGIIIGQNDTELLIASNNHVVENANEVSVGFVDESVVEASIKGTDADNDVAVVAVKLEDISDDTKAAIREAKIGDSDSLALGDQVVAIGNALGYGQSVTSGYVSALNRELELSDGTNTFTSTGLIQTDAAINSGNSGGGLFNMKGELIGINEAKSSGSGSSQEASVDNIGFAIPTDKALPILQELMKQETKEVIDEDKRGYLGVSCADVSDEYSQLYDMPEGVCFTSVLSGGPAEKAGAKKGDVLVEFDGEKITTYDALKDALKYHSAGDTVEITVKRADNGEYKEVKLTVTLATADEAGVTQNNASAGSGQQPGTGGQSQQPDANGSDGADGSDGSDSGNANGDGSQDSQSSSDENSQDQQDSQIENPFKGTPFEDFFGF